MRFWSSSSLVQSKPFGLGLNPLSCITTKKNCERVDRLRVDQMGCTKKLGNIPKKGRETCRPIINDGYRVGSCP